MQPNETLEQICLGLPGVVVPEGASAQWVTEAGRCVNLQYDDPVLTVSWPVTPSTGVSRQVKVEDPFDASLQLIELSDALSFQIAFSGHRQLIGKMFKVTGVRAAGNTLGVIIKVARHGNRLASLELKYTEQAGVQVREVGGVFRRQPGLSQPLVQDLWGSSEMLQEWFRVMASKYVQDRDSLMHEH